MRSLRLQDSDLPSRPDFGTIGTQIKLRTNFFPINVPKGPIHEYDIAIEPAANNKRLKRRIFHLAEQSNEWKQAGMTNKVAHDHSAKMYGAIKIPSPFEIKILYTDEDEEEEHRDQPRAPKEYTMTIKYTQEIDTQGLVRYVCSTSRPSSPFLLGRGSVMRARCTTTHCFLVPPAPHMLSRPFLSPSFPIHQTRVGSSLC